jgi:hypothetical protein
MGIVANNSSKVKQNKLLEINLHYFYSGASGAEPLTSVPHSLLLARFRRASASFFKANFIAAAIQILRKEAASLADHNTLRGESLGS